MAKLQNCRIDRCFRLQLIMLNYENFLKQIQQLRFCRSLIGGVSKSPEMNRVPGVYKLAIKEALDKGSPGVLVGRAFKFSLFPCFIDLFQIPIKFSARILTKFLEIQKANCPHCVSSKFQIAKFFSLIKQNFHKFTFHYNLPVKRFFFS